MNVGRIRVTIAVLVAAALLGGAAPTPVMAATVGTVGPLAKPTQDWAGKSLKVNWPAVRGITTFETKWSATSTFTKATYKESSSNSVWITNLVPAKQYYVATRTLVGKTTGPWSKTLPVSLIPHAVGVFGKVTASPAVSGFNVTFDAVPDATEYRVRWSAGPNENRTPDRWQQHFSPWFSAFKPAKTTYFVPTSDADLTSTRFGNPTFIRIQARNTYYSTFVRQSVQVSGWPVPDAPAATGTTLKVATYNVMCSSCEPAGAPKWAARAPAVAQTINQRDPDILFAQEANGDSTVPGSPQTYLDLERRLDRLTLVDADKLPSTVTVAGTRLYYDPQKLTLIDHGRLAGVKNYRFFPETAAPDNNIPWAEFLTRDSNRTRFIAVSAQYAIPSASYTQTPKALVGKNSQQVLQALASLATVDARAADLPVILGGDLNDQRYPEEAVDGAQPTLVRGGFSDASASVKRVGTSKPTYNKYKTPSEQADDPNRDGIRIDYLLTRGFSGSREFTNNWNPGTNVIGSDHNMVDTVLVLPSS